MGRKEERKEGREERERGKEEREGGKERERKEEENKELKKWFWNNINHVDLNHSFIPHPKIYLRWGIDLKAKIIMFLELKKKNTLA